MWIPSCSQNKPDLMMMVETIYILLQHSRTPTGTKTRGASGTSKDRSLNVSMSMSSWKKVKSCTELDF